MSEDILLVLSPFVVFTNKSREKKAKFTVFIACFFFVINDKKWICNLLYILHLIIPKGCLRDPFGMHKSEPPMKMHYWDMGCLYILGAKKSQQCPQIWPCETKRREEFHCHQMVVIKLIWHKRLVIKSQYYAQSNLPQLINNEWINDFWKKITRFFLMSFRILQSFTKESIQSAMGPHN